MQPVPGLGSDVRQGVHYNVFYFSSSDCVDSYISRSTDTPFVRPRKPGSGHEFDGVATMLACHIVTAPPRESSSPMDFSDHSSTSLLSLRYPMSRDSRSHCGDTEVAFLDLPLEAHVIPGRGRQLSAALPFLCIASSDNVADLMASVACQRYIWGNPQPVVGFVLSETGVLARLVVSWVDAATVSHTFFRWRSFSSALKTFSMSSISHCLRHPTWASSISQTLRLPCVSRNSF